MNYESGGDEFKFDQSTSQESHFQLEERNPFRARGGIGTEHPLAQLMGSRRFGVGSCDSTAPY